MGFFSVLAKVALSRSLMNNTMCAQLTLSMRVCGSAYAFWTRQTYISCEISIEHSSMGIASLAQLEKWFPLLGERVHTLYFWSFQKQNREEVGQNKNKRPINLPKVIRFCTDYKYTTNPNLYHTQ